ncbi:enoyl-CoA hydratase/isomerase family protein [Paenibacillus naphthalenovorans]|uniref:enoyl-CoA hydratase/isomerase family protein n=1 Tax=Paenibacillus naphthalenovorans TaxID=162209 RepID=UPI00087FB29B|nr:enoyl-CoA hydratase-related protein [Paenibacillus naphthalenovorans]GCL71863.1 crotonase [Paenibacillus naphthalenovorans]SDI40847.1 enoyl-CoA hydratase [Paenibacillus naphthalenovorans]
MQSFQYLRFENSSGLATIVLNRPETLNAINDAVLDELDQAFTMLERDDQTRVVMITGGGDKAFVAGGDIAAMRQMSVLEGEKFVYRGQEVLKKIEDSRKVVIAALNGYTLGGGLELALACDIRIASEKAKLGLPEVCIGLYPGWGGTQRLVRLAGKGIAKALVFTGERISAEEARELGIVNKVVKHEELMTYCRTLAQKIMENSPIAVMQAKKAINQGSEISLDQALVLEAEAWLVNFSTEDRVEGLTSFLEKRKPHYQGK